MRKKLILLHFVENIFIHLINKNIAFQENWIEIPCYVHVYMYIYIYIDVIRMASEAILI